MSTTQSATTASSAGYAAEAGTVAAGTTAAGAADTARRIAELSPDQRARLEARLRERLARRPAAAAGVPRRTPGAPVPLSFAQEQIWLAQQLAPDSAAYNVPMAVVCRGPLDAERLARAFRTVISRHEVLRTTFAAGADGSPVQLVHEQAGFELPVTDLRSTADAGAQVRERLAAEAHTPFDLASGPLLRAALLRTGDQEHVLVLTAHHIAVDAWSVNVLLGEVAAAYRSAAGPAGGAELPPLPVQYGDFAAWQRGRLDGAAYQESLDYWQQRLSGLTDTPPPATATGRPEGGARAGSHSLELPAELTAGLRALAARHRTTLFTVALAALQTLLYRYGCGEDPVVATPVGGRERTELEGLIGCFINTLLLRGDLSPGSAGEAPTGEPTFAELLDRAAEATRRDLQHQEVPFEQLAARLRAGSPEGLARTMLVLDQAAPGGAPAEESAAAPGELVLRPLDGAGPADAKRDLTFTVSETGDTLVLTLVHRTDRYEDRSAERLLAHYATLLREACADPHRPVGRLPLLTAAERALVLDGWNATALEVSAGTFHGRFAEQAARTPQAVAVVGADGTHRYAELDRLANRLAHHLRGLGVGAETPVGICLERGAWTVVALLAVLKAGGCYVPIDPAQPQERMAMMLADTAAPVVITRADSADRLPAAVQAVVVEELALDALPDTAPEVAVDPGQAAYVLFTSGSTGRPKGVVVEHRQVLNYRTAVVSALALVPEAGYAMVQPFTFDSCVTVLSAALLGGGTLHMVDADTASDGRRLAAYFEEHAIDYLKISPSHLAALEGPGGEHRVLPRRGLILGGEGSTSTFVREVLGRAGCEVFNHYGPTETTVGVTTHHPRIEDLAATATVPIGRPLGNVRAYVLDGRGEPVPVGVPGELFIGGAQVTRGYLGRPGLTAERFVPDPFGAPGARLYRTGDLTRRLADSTIEFLGRLDDQVKIRGFRIELGEVEAALAALTPVAAAAAVVREDRPGDRQLVGYLVPAPGAEVEPAALRTELAKALPGYMVPSALVVLDALPLTAHNKLDRRALPAPPRQEAVPGRAARDEREAALCRIFAEVLGTERAPGIDEDFFDLGGHSLLAMRLVAAVRTELGAELGIRDLFEAPTVAELAARVAGAAPAAVLPPLVRAERPDALPLSFAQRRLWFLNRMERGTSAYAMPVVLRLSEAVDTAALQAALDDVVERHETLRTLFPETDGEPHQDIRPATPHLIPLHTLDATDETDAHTHITTLATTPFDLTTQLPLRATLLTLAPDHHLLTLVLHHIAGDGWSMQPLTHDLTTAYHAHTTGRTPNWPELPVQYADYTLWQHHHLGNPDTPGTPLHTQLTHWTNHLTNLPDTIPLPTDHPRPTNPTHQARTHTTHTHPTTHHQLTTHAHTHHATLFHTLHAALATLLTRNGAGTDLPIGTPTAGRTHPHLDHLIGFFVNTLVLRTDTTGNPTHTQLLHHTRDLNLTALTHQDLPFERLVEALNPTRTPHHHPLFQTILTLNNTTEGTDGWAPDAPVGPEGEAGRTAKFDLSFTVTEHRTADGAPDGLTVTIEYAADLFEPATVERLADQFQRILRSAAEHPDTPIHDIDLFTEHERRALFTDWNGPTRELPGRTLPELFAAQVARTPDATAVTCGTDALSYTELDTAANRLARHLVARGAGPERLVALAVPRSVETLVAVLAVLKAGAAYLPIDLTHPGERIAYTLADAQPLCVLTTTEAAAQLPATGHPHLLLDGPETVAALAALPAHELTDADRSAPLSLRNPAYVIYTSGSTGRPKGVVVEHHSLDAYLAWAREAYGSVAGRALVHSPVSFDLTVTGLFAPLTSGGTVQLIELDDQAPTAGEFERPTFVKATPSHLALLTALPERFSPSEQLVLGGESLMGEVLDEWRRRHPGATVINEYGPTETTVGCTEFRIEPGDTAPSGVITIGRPVWNTRMYVLDGALRALPIGVGGELYIAGDLVTRGYLGRPALTAERFLPDPFGGPGSRMYRTGDLGRWHQEGRLEFLGRTDDQIKLRGFRIDPAEIETHFTGRADIAQAAVLLREDSPGDPRLVAYLVPTGDAVPDPAELRATAAARLPAHLVPSAVVLLDTLPLTPNGKLDRRALPAPATTTGGTGRAPRTPREEVLCGLFATTLNTGTVGIDDNFFDLGGHSLLAARLTARIRDELGVRIGLRALFETPTVALLAERIGGEGDTGSSDGLGQLLPLRTGGTRPPLFAVHPGGGLGWCYSGLVRHLDRDRPLFALQARGLGGDGELPGSVAEMATDYLRLIREVQPSGPYHLLGWSFGGTVAHELARQLQAAGEEVALLAMLDSHPTGRFRHAGRPGDAEILSLALDGLDLDELGAAATDAVAATAGDGDALGDGLPTAAAVSELLRVRGSVLAGLDPAALHRLVKVTANNIALARGEQPGRYRGRVLFFEALPGRGADGTPLTELWTEHVDGPIENHPLDIPHSRFTTPEALDVIGPILAAHLR
ncbi:non-ribosomal peptide synthetase [Kitasatospora sp. A2-31]|uniref:amino acid adenylation domain-containing protein n=1 Tax=Kitasatospora sp. A2-31 TaxID=2916414 RepID=UPI001EEB5EE0|nr:non-ribosomal peptide synthetase [Kitasatospora sp. A2-31]MCG6498026.1 amino acid adenylation domain-containing protein [Kitasatospora sp. A2-31]